MTRFWNAATAFVLLLAWRSPAAEASRPHVLFVLADDLGWGDPSCYGNKQFATPALDRLAKEGALFTQFYVGGSVCSPSRAAFLTGRWPAELRLHGHLAKNERNESRGMPNHLDPAVPTLARVLRDAGYFTAHVGKWHLGRPPGAPPAFQVYGFEHAGLNDGDGKESHLWDPKSRHDGTSRLVDSALDAISRRGDRPFYLQLWLTDPHAPLNPSPEQLKPFVKLRGGFDVSFTPPATIWAAAVTEMDNQLGRLLDALDAMKLADDTIVVFSSDNGPEEIQIYNASWIGVGSPGPFRGRKRSLYEGGVRTPFLVRWPAGLRPGVVNDATVVSGADWLPTVCELTGTPVPNDVRRGLQGQSVAAAFRGDATYRRSTPLFWEWRFDIFGHPANVSPQLAVRDGDWKLLLSPDRSRVELYRIPVAPMEVDNVAGDNPELVERLTRMALDWHATLPPGPSRTAAGRNGYPFPKAMP